MTTDPEIYRQHYRTAYSNGYQEGTTPRRRAPNWEVSRKSGHSRAAPFLYSATSPRLPAFNVVARSARLVYRAVVGVYFHEIRQTLSTLVVFVSWFVGLNMQRSLAELLLKHPAPRQA
jgi:hypothetical protein